MHEDNEEKNLDRPSPRELEVLGLPADATDAPLSVEQLEKLARHYAAWLYTLGFTYEAYGQSASRERHEAAMRLSEIGRLIGVDRLKVVTADIDRERLETWDEDVAKARAAYAYLLKHGKWPPSDWMP